MLDTEQALTLKSQEAIPWIWPSPPRLPTAANSGTAGRFSQESSLLDRVAAQGRVVRRSWPRSSGSGAAWRDGMGRILPQGTSQQR
jgi:hypothetical protein